MGVEIFILPIIAFGASLLTFFSGFGLGTILLPVFAIWFPIDTSVALTAIVHFLNNIFKLVLVGKFADLSVALKFGIPAILAAFLGANILMLISDWAPLAEYRLNERTFQITSAKLLIAGLMMFFSLFEIVPRLRKIQVASKYLPLGGLLSGFFGGLSGHQGALRSVFLVRAGLSKRSFIATGVVIACLVDIARIGVYLRNFAREGFTSGSSVIVVTTLAAFAGAYFGNKLIPKITMQSVQTIVFVGIFLLSLAVGAGLV
jgi:uncharacterized protein